ncbi:MAG: hypothetical protein WBP12_03605 [Candidatus Saccharimonas sp.]
MNSSLSLSQITKLLSKFLHRFHVILFALIVIGGLSAATFILYETTVLSTKNEPNISNSSFDKSTIEKIEKLRDPNDPSEPLNLPSGRTNPFR